MGTIEECVNIFEKLLFKRYIFLLENDIEIELFFQKGYFYHMLGLEKLVDIMQLNGSASKIYKDIQKGRISHKLIKKSSHYDTIRERIKYFDYIPDLLHSSKIIIDFDKSLLKNKNGTEYSKLINTKYILFRRVDSGYIHLTIGQKSKEAYPETFFYEPSKRYISEQNLLSIRNVRIIDIKR